MPALTQNQLSELRSKLDAREAELGGEVKALNQEANESDHPIANVGDFGERGEELIRGAVRHAEKERDQSELRQIDDARERMDRGSYGVCIDCGIDIAYERLEVQPFSERCLPCQEAYEATHPADIRISTAS